MEDQARCQPRMTISHATNLLYSPPWQPLMHFEWASSSRHCSSAAEIFHFRLIHIHSNARNSIKMDPVTFSIRDIRLSLHSSVQLAFKERLQKYNNILNSKRNICYWLAGRSIWGKTVTEVLKILPEAAGRGQHFQARGHIFFPMRTDPEPHNNVLIFFLVVNCVSSGFVYAKLSLNWWFSRHASKLNYHASKK